MNWADQLFKQVYLIYIFGASIYRETSTAIPLIKPCLLTNYNKLPANYSAFISCDVPNDGKFVLGNTSSHLNYTFSGSWITF